MNLRPIFSLFALALAACTGAGRESYPSLAIRPVEKGDFASPSSPESSGLPTERISDPALEADIARLSAQAKDGAAAFDRSFPDAEQRVKAASGTAVSSEAWVAAQVAISGLEAARNDSVSALAGLDTLYVDRANAIADGKAQGGADAIDAARRDALALVDSQNDRLDGLKALLAQPL